jgi:hypothetical protein
MLEQLLQRIGALVPTKQDEPAAYTDTPSAPRCGVACEVPRHGRKRVDGGGRARSPQHRRDTWPLRCRPNGCKHEQPKGACRASIGTRLKYQSARAGSCPRGDRSIRLGPLWRDRDLCHILILRAYARVALSGASVHGYKPGLHGSDPLRKYGASSGVTALPTCLPHRRYAVFFPCSAHNFFRA